ncbi:MAG: PspC domain-containing protein [Clostridia bacterium]|nr:PspC domain-containing protein [Clostridia bacterium]
MKRLYRSKTDRKLTGLCAGIAQYFNADPSIIRLIAVLLCLGAGSGILAYIIASLVVPEEPDNNAELNQ